MTIDTSKQQYARICKTTQQFRGITRDPDDNPDCDTTTVIPPSYDPLENKIPIWDGSQWNIGTL